MTLVNESTTDVHYKPVVFAMAATNTPTLASLYTTANKNTFMHESIETAIENWPKYFSKNLKVTQNGNELTFDTFREQMETAKKMWPVIDVRYKMLTESGRSVASAEHVWIPTPGLWFDTVIVMTFGEVGTEDEHKVVTFLEIMQEGPKDRNPDDAEFKSIA